MAIVVPTCPPAFDYSLSNSGNIAVVVGSSGSNTIIRTLTSGTTQAVSLTVTGIPSNTSYTVIPGSANPQSPASASGNSTLTITTTALTPPGNYPITVTGAPLGKTTTFNLIVSASTVNPITYISALPNPVAYGGTPNISWHSDYATSCTSLSGNFSTNTVVPNATQGTNVGVAQTAPTNYTVFCSGTPGSTPSSASINVTVAPQRPAISSLVASPACASNATPATVNIAWTNSTLATSYRLHRSPTGAPGTYSQLPIGAPVDVTSPYADTGLGAGTYYYQVQALNASGSSYSAPMSIDIPSCSGFDYRLSATPTVTVAAGDFIANTITANYVNGTAESIFFSIPANVLPPGVTLQSFSPTSCNPGATRCNIVLTLNTASNTTTGTYTITVHGVSQDTSIARDVNFALVVTNTPVPPGLNVTCTASPINVDLANNRSVTWTANVTNGTPPFTYTWSGDYPLAPDTAATTASRVKTKTVTYVDNTVTPKKGYITVTDSGTPQLSAVSYQCPSTVDVIDTDTTPDFALTATPKVSMNFVGSTATSNIIGVTIGSIDGFNGDVILTGGPSSININGVDYPLTYEFYNHDTLDQNSVIANFRYGTGLDMVVRSTSQIPTGSYQITVTGISGTLVHSKPVILEVGTVRPIFQEF
jgi:hypothetical protein